MGQSTTLPQLQTIADMSVRVCSVRWLPSHVLNGCPHDHGLLFRQMPWSKSDLLAVTTRLTLSRGRVSENYILLKSYDNINQTLRICIQVQFSQRYGQIKDRRPNFFFEYFCLGMTLRPEGSRNLF